MRRAPRRNRLPNVAAATAVLAVFAAAVPAFSSDNASTRAREAAGPALSPESNPSRAALPSHTRPAAKKTEQFFIARPRREWLALRGRPGGSVVGHVGGTTEFGSPQTLGVVKRRGGWLGVATTALPNGSVGWVKLKDVRLARTGVSLTLDLSERRLLLRSAGRVVRRMTVGVGRPGSPTPKGRFAVTDKLAGSTYGSYYGCCIVALSAHQPNLPAGWTGGDRIAIHGTNDPASIGRASSAGCPHAGEADMHVLMRRVPLGAPVFVRA